jgi:hypothetical protein
MKEVLQEGKSWQVIDGEGYKNILEIRRKL